MDLHCKQENQHFKYFKQIGQEYISETVGNNHRIRAKPLAWRYCVHHCTV